MTEGPGPDRWDIAALAELIAHNKNNPAVSWICSDLPCELWWDGSRSLLACPCHNKTFTADGRSNEAYPLPPLDTVKVRITGEGRVEVFGV